MSAPLNITNAALLEQSGLQSGDPVHIGVVGNHVTNDALFVRKMVEHNTVLGVVLSIHGKESEYPWGDLIELWPLPCTHAHSEPHKFYRVDKLKKKLFGDSKK